MSGELSAPSVRQSLAAIRMLFDWLVEGRIVFAESGSSVRGPKAPADGATISVLTAAEWRLLVDRIPDTTLRDLRDRALITTLTYTFARISAALALRVEDFRPNGPGWELGCMKSRAVGTHALAIGNSSRRYTAISRSPNWPATVQATCSAPAAAGARETLSDLPMT